MKKIALTGSVLIIAGAALLAAEGDLKKESQADMPKMPEPQKEHKWLEQFVGDWDADIQMYMEPGKSPQTQKGTEHTRSIGGFWIVAENKGTFMEKPFTGIMTLGYQPDK